MVNPVPVVLDLDTEKTTVIDTSKVGDISGEWRLVMARVLICLLFECSWSSCVGSWWREGAGDSLHWLGQLSS